MKTFVMALSFLMLVGTSAQVKSSDTLTKVELRTAAPAVIQRKLRDQIWQMFEPDNYRTKKRPQNALTGLSLKTRTLPTMVPGLCRYDVAHIEFEPVEKNEPDADTPSKAKGLTAVSYFKFVSPPAHDFNRIADNSKSHQTPCSTLPDKGFFDAEDEEVATDGYLVWSKLQGALREKRTVPLECELFKTDNEPCSLIVAAIASDELTSVDRCTAKDYHEQCFEISTDDRRITIYANAHVYPGPPPNEVIRAKVEGLITLSHPRID